MTEIVDQPDVKAQTEANNQVARLLADLLGNESKATRGMYIVQELAEEIAAFLQLHEDCHIHQGYWGADALTLMFPWEYKHEAYTLHRKMVNVSCNYYGVTSPAKIERTGSTPRYMHKDKASMEINLKFDGLSTWNNDLIPAQKCAYAAAELKTCFHPDEPPEFLKKPGCGWITPEPEVKKEEPPEIITPSWQCRRPTKGDSNDPF